MKKKTRNAILAVVVLPVVILALFYVSTAMNAEMASMQLQYYNDGQPVSTPFQLINEGGQEIDSVAVTVTWSISGDNVDWTTLQLTGAVIVYISGGGEQDSQLTRQDFTSSDQQGSKTLTFALETLFAHYSSGDYTLRFHGLLTVSAKDLAGNDISDSWNGDRTISVSWDDGSGSLTLTAEIS